jgi:hypothetical protein
MVNFGPKVIIEKFNKLLVIFERKRDIPENTISKPNFLSREISTHLKIHKSLKTYVSKFQG